MLHGCSGGEGEWRGGGGQGLDRAWQPDGRAVWNMSVPRTTRSMDVWGYVAGYVEIHGLLPSWIRGDTWTTIQQLDTSAGDAQSRYLFPQLG